VVDISNCGDHAFEPDLRPIVIGHTAVTNEQHARSRKFLFFCLLLLFFFLLRRLRDISGSRLPPKIDRRSTINVNPPCSGKLLVGLVLHDLRVCSIATTNRTEARRKQSCRNDVLGGAICTRCAASGLSEKTIQARLRHEGSRLFSSRGDDADFLFLFLFLLVGATDLSSCRRAEHHQPGQCSRTSPACGPRGTLARFAEMARLASILASNSCQRLVACPLGRDLQPGIESRARPKVLNTRFASITHGSDSRRAMSPKA